MTDVYLLAMVRLLELEQRREAELARWGREQAPRDAGHPVSRPRIVLAQWLMAAAERLWPAAGREVMGGTR
jgi:hypothetical protein